jgi:hypothetical protein
MGFRTDAFISYIKNLSQPSGASLAGREADGIAHSSAAGQVTQGARRA